MLEVQMHLPVVRLSDRRSADSRLADLEIADRPMRVGGGKIPKITVSKHLFKIFATLKTVAKRIDRSGNLERQSVDPPVGLWRPHGRSALPLWGAHHEAGDFPPP